MSDSKSDPKKEAPIPISVEDWRRLHSKEFMDTIQEKIWGKITKVLGAGSIVALVAFAVTIFGPVQNMVVAEATRKVSQGLSDQLKKDIEDQTKKVAQEFLKRELVIQTASPPTASGTRGAVTENQSVLPTFMERIVGFFSTTPQLVHSTPQSEGSLYSILSNTMRGILIGEGGRRGLGSGPINCLLRRGGV